MENTYRNLSKEGLSMSDAQSLSNLCNQEAQNISKKLQSVGLYNKSVLISGSEKVIFSTDKMPNNVEELLKRKSLLHSFQGYLMDAMKRKDELIKLEQSREFVYNIVQPVSEKPEPDPVLTLVKDDWGFSQLTNEEYNQYIEDEAYASHIGQFIHKDSALEKLRTEVYKVPTIEWIELKKDEKTPVDIHMHHESDFYETLYKNLSNLHRDYEKKVNYIKAKVKNLVSDENQKRLALHKEKVQEIAQKNTEKRQKYNEEYNKWLADYKKAVSDFEKEKINTINELSKLKIVMDSRFVSLKESLYS